MARSNPGPMSVLYKICIGVKTCRWLIAGIQCPGRVIWILRVVQVQQAVQREGCRNLTGPANRVWAWRICHIDKSRECSVHQP